MISSVKYEIITEITFHSERSGLSLRSSFSLPNEAFLVYVASANTSTLQHFNTLTL